MKQWVKSEIIKKTYGNNNKIIHDTINKLEHKKDNQLDDSFNNDYEDKPNKKRAVEENRRAQSQGLLQGHGNGRAQVQAPYKCIFNLNEKNYTTTTINDLKTQFEMKRQENDVKILIFY